MTSRKAGVTVPKRQLREKVVQIYDLLLKGEDFVATTNSGANFWEEFFLLKPKVMYAQSEINKIASSQLIQVLDNINLLLENSIIMLNNDNIIRVVHAMETFCVFACSVFRKSYDNCETTEDVQISLDFEKDAQKIQIILSCCESFLLNVSDGESGEICCSLALKVLIILSVRKNQMDINYLVEQIMGSSHLFEHLVKLLSDTRTRQMFGHDVVILITLLVNFRKYEALNPYIVKLSILDDELALNGYSQVITSSLCEFCIEFNRVLTQNQSSSWISSFTNLVGNIFISEDGAIRLQQMKANNAFLLAFYEAIHLNRNFITTLAHTQTDSALTCVQISDIQSTVSSVELPVLSAEPSNLLVTFFQYCTIVMQDTKSETGSNAVKLCFLILNCITEDQYANSLMHDVGLAFKVCLHRMPMRHRRSPADITTAPQPLVCSLLDILVEYIQSHEMKKFPLELYILCLNVLQRLLCYQKRCRIRLNYLWKNVWTSLLHLLRFVLQHENYLFKKMNIIFLMIQIINIFNFFITYGDTFLPTPASYDELYYEIIRERQTFDNASSMGLRYSTTESEYKEFALQLNNSLVNVRAIIKHFTPKIEQWLHAVHLSTPTEQQILDVLKKNYDSLTLKLLDSLDQYDRYSEKPSQIHFFSKIIQDILSDIRENITLSLLNLQKRVCENDSLAPK